MKVSLIGSVQKDGNTSSGQQIRTKVLYNELVNIYGANNVILINTINYKFRFVIVFFELFFSLFKTKKYILMVSSNGRKTLSLLMYLFKKVFHKDIYNNVIGGNYDLFLSKNVKHIKYAKSFKVNWVQTNIQKDKLEMLGLNNVKNLPNFKNYKDYLTSPVYFNKPIDKFRFCTFSRINKDKGIDKAIEVIRDLNHHYGKNIASLTVFGKVDKSYLDEFDNSIKENTFLNYGGLISYDEANIYLKDFYCLLFPTTFHGEGFPGTLLDSLFAGLPAIASEWMYNREIIEPNKTGFLFDPKNSQDFLSILIFSIENIDLINQMRKNCLDESNKYYINNILSIIVNDLADED